MKKMLMTSFILVVAVAVSIGFAQTGGDHGSMGGAMTGEQQDEAPKEQMADRGQMMTDMMGMMNEMSGMMEKMHRMMMDMSPERVKAVSGIMKDMARHITDMSGMMEKAAVSEPDLDKMHEKMEEMNKKIDDAGKTR